MKKKELITVWKNLDKALDSINYLSENDFEVDEILFSNIVSLKNEVEDLIHAKTKTKRFEGF